MCETPPIGAICMEREGRGQCEDDTYVLAAKTDAQKYLPRPITALGLPAALRGEIVEPPSIGPVSAAVRGFKKGCRRLAVWHSMLLAERLTMEVSVQSTAEVCLYIGSPSGTLCRVHRSAHMQMRMAHYIYIYTQVSFCICLEP